MKTSVMPRWEKAPAAKPSQPKFSMMEGKNWPQQTDLYTNAVVPVSVCMHMWEHTKINKFN